MILNLLFKPPINLKHRNYKAYRTSSVVLRANFPIRPGRAPSFRHQQTPLAAGTENDHRHARRPAASEIVPARPG